MFTICKTCGERIKANGLTLEERQIWSANRGKDRCEICGQQVPTQEIMRCSGSCAPFPHAMKVAGPSETKGKHGKP